MLFAITDCGMRRHSSLHNHSKENEFFWLISMLFVGQTPELVFNKNNSGTSQIDDRFIAYLAAGIPTSQVAAVLPECVDYGDDSPRLVNNRTGQITAYRGMGQHSESVVGWNFTAFPSMLSSYTGVYHCVNSIGKSSESYALGVVGKFSAH